MAGEEQYQLVTFQLGEELYGVNIMDVKEIVKTQPVRPLELNLTQEYLSFHSGVTRITIGKWEKGEKTPISFDLYNVLKVLYKDPSEFWAELFKNYERTLSPIQKAADKKKFMAFLEQAQKNKKGDT